VSWKTLVSTLAVAFGEDPPKRTIPSLLLRAAAWASEAASLVIRQEAGLTREQVRTSTSEHRYSNERARTELGCSFHSFEETAAWLARELDEA
jgi:dihydroflavonol-4-reductase